MFSVSKVHDRAVMDADPVEQARILCAIMVSAMPSAVCRAFIEMLAGDYGALLEIGNAPDLHRHGAQKKHKPLTTKQKAEIKKAIGPAHVVAAKFNIHRSTVYRIRQEV